MKTLLALLVLLALLNSCSSTIGNTDTAVVLGTFNLEWLGDGTADQKPRVDHDYLMIADVIVKTEADLLAVQEIENEQALRKVVRYLEGYDGFLADGGGRQKVGVIYRKGMQVTKLGDYMPLTLGRPERLRPGLVLQCKRGNFDWIEMVVHLKSTSRFDSTAQMSEESKQIRMKQAEVLRTWSDSVTSGKEKDVIIAGDFNDYPQRQQFPTLTSLTAAPNLIFLTRNLRSCKNKQWNGIDHVVASVTASQRFMSGSEHTEDIYSFLPPGEAEKVSDHCPVVVRFETTSADAD